MALKTETNRRWNTYLLTNEHGKIGKLADMLRRNLFDESNDVFWVSA